MKQKTIEDFNLIADGVLAQPSSVLKLRRDMLARELLRAYESGQQNPVLPEGLPTAENIAGVIEYSRVSEGEELFNHDNVLTTIPTLQEAFAACHQAGYEDGVKSKWNKILHLTNAVDFFAIVIHSGGYWSPTCQEYYDAAVNDSSLPTDTADAKTK